tara:strand:+ start:7790 stop:9232 length:1443 start_codon:yes stop_codon:yes gene_type:complete
MADILITGGTIVTMDPNRRVIDDGAIALEADRIVAVGSREEVESNHKSDRVIDAAKNVILPGLIDGHGHAGHALVKTIGHGPTGMWGDIVDYVYAEGTDEEFWYADALLSSVDRLKNGTTCGVTYFGGGTMIMRTNKPVYADKHCDAVTQVGIREFIAVGPSNPPYPRKYVSWSSGAMESQMVNFDQYIKTSEEIINNWHDKGSGRIQVSIMSPTINPSRDPYKEMSVRDIKDQAKRARDLAYKYDLIFTQDGHDTGTVEFAHRELGILGPKSLLSHSTGLTEEEINICSETDTKIAHNPSSGNSYPSRCPVPELLDSGVTVALGSDGSGPDMNYDMFRHMYVCMRQHRGEQRDGAYMPPGKVLEMATIDAAHALGLGDQIGSLEVGKKADLILIDMNKPHLYPLNMPVHRVVGFANGQDVDTVIVDGQVLMRNRRLTVIDEQAVLEQSQSATELMLKRTGLHSKLEIQPGFWGSSRYPF